MPDARSAFVSAAFLVLCLLCAPALAAEEPRQAPDGPTPSGPGVPPHRADPSLIVDFEDQLVPPTGWTRVTTNADFTWKLAQAGTPHGGSGAADVDYDPDLDPQNEWLVSPLLDIHSATLTFWSRGSLHYCRDVEDNCDLQVWVIRGSVGDGGDDFVAFADDDWIGTFQWSQSVIDLTPFVSASSVLERVAFRYHGQDGAQIQLDDIQLSGNFAPPVVVFTDGLETGNTSVWSGAVGP